MSDEATMAAGIMALLGVMIIPIILLAVFQIICWWKVFQKAGKPGWACLIPIYSTIVILEIVGKPWWWFLLMLIPGLGLIWAIWTINLLSLSFGKDVGFTIGILLLSVVFIAILAFGKAEYQGPAGAEGASPSPAS